jgi:chaperonin GroES
MNLKAIQDKVIVKAQEAVKETSGGIIIANASNEGVIQGKVLSIGPGAYDDAEKKFIATTTQVGDTILFNLHGGITFKHEDEEYVTITEKEIIAVLS